MKGKSVFVTALLTSTLLANLQAHPDTSSHTNSYTATASAFSARTLVRGSSGGDVYELQGRLRHLGFYTGRIDGVFGWQTYWSVRNFQQRFGLRVDGRVGSTTRTKLIAATRNYHPATTRNKAGTARIAQNTQPIPASTSLYGPISPNDLKLLANAVNGESRGESFEGQVAVAAVILNRLKSPLFPHTIAGIIFQPGAFTAVADGQIWLPPQPSPKRAVIAALNGWDPSDGAIYYFNPATATSKWIWSRPQIKRIGHHIFCR